MTAPACGYHLLNRSPRKPSPSPTSASPAPSGSTRIARRADPYTESDSGSGFGDRGAAGVGAAAGTVADGAGDSAGPWPRPVRYGRSNSGPSRPGGRVGAAVAEGAAGGGPVVRDGGAAGCGTAGGGA